MYFNGILTGCDLIQRENTGKPESTGCDLLQWEITGKPESTGCDLIQWEITGSSVPSLNWVPLSKLQIKFSHSEQWESDSAQENHTLPCNITLKINEFEN